ncbi:hypothetical protein RBH29_11245 [Herbivorax sp. ANBcel31]|uniref:hypothetical protein n=1 Tax=Herbivorax sp. ANBcel31 TaxID=3069754 RepID=UPI0027B705C7|nr:hypothetical protein [Herbivorax sp. ANBcel31]MDQ2087002.1 hypothetical protein [Herbivorax sp. ANBcel31]
MNKSDRLMTCNRDWTGVTILTKKGRHVFVNHSQIEEIRLGYFTVSKIFSKKVTEKIEIRVKGVKSPVIITKPMDWDRFDQYKREISKFASDNKIPLIDIE